MGRRGCPELVLEKVDINTGAFKRMITARIPNVVGISVSVLRLPAMRMDNEATPNASVCRTAAVLPRRSPGIFSCIKTGTIEDQSKIHKPCNRKLRHIIQRFVLKHKMNKLMDKSVTKNNIEKYSPSRAIRPL